MSGIPGDGKNLHDRVRETSPGSAVLTGESSSGRPSFQVNVSGSGSGGRQVSACAGEERPSFYFQIQEIVFHLSILLQQPYHHWVQLLRQECFHPMYIRHPKYITLGPQVNVRLQKVFEVQYLKQFHRFSLIQHHLLFRLGLRPQFSLQVQHLRDC